MRELLDKCYNLTVRINDISLQIVEIETALYYPTNQVISDMPKGGSTGNRVDSLLSKLEKLKEEREIAKEEHAQEWAIINILLDKHQISPNEQRLFVLRFSMGYPWKACAAILADETGEEWNENRVYRTLRCICEKCTK